ncbi:PEP/pyruvate-binding domain-containing protein [Desulfatibacillum aliphaticivorans]|uniref:PEP/pyruvate-binding domain-containing protein n=1 Tax=Desulfatibacillum aliphaticivorans TaxID=218208 RepID=UPI00041BA8A4|nr:PEP/pyruvate-binding domain-containing protein [Desulfatibacillum aliphaticivorans]
MALKSNPLWTPISKRTKPSIELQGGKGANLVRLARAGFPVPGGVILTTRLLKNADQSNLSRLQNLICKALASFPAQTQWAVRSSGTSEDGHQASFAGQHDTFLNVPRDELAARVLDCLDSSRSLHADVYRDKMEQSSSSSMAVVIQAMVNAQCAGVLFTRHPVLPHVDCIVVEGIPGLGEDLVSGRKNPDRLELSRSGRRLEAVFYNPNMQCLDAVGDAIFCEAANTIEKAMAAPQDVEWAYDGRKLWILQTRPITTLKRPSKVWTRAWGDEFWAEATTDLQYTLMGRWIRDDYIRDLGRICGWDFLSRVEPFERINSHVYFNPEYMRRLLRLVHPAMRMERQLNWMPPYWRAEASSIKFRPAALALSLLRSSLADKNSGMLSHYKRLPKYLKQVQETLIPELGQDFSPLSDKELWQRLMRNDRMGRAHFKFVRWGLGSYLAPTRMICAWICENWTSRTQTADPEGHYFEMLLTSPQGNSTTRVNEEIEQLSRLASKIPGLRERLICSPDLPSLDDIVAMPESKSFVSEFNGFIQRHGHRGSSRETRLPRWMDDPSLILNNILAFAASGMEGSKVGKTKDRKDSWLQEVRRQPGGWWKRAIAEKSLSLAREYVRYRENQRYALDYILADMRRVILEMASRLKTKGLLKQEDDIFFVTYNELKSLWDGAASMPPDVEVRRAGFLKDSSRLPPEWILDGEPFPKKRVAAKNGFRGTPASPGSAKGTARVVMRVEDLRSVRQGDILVAPNTDPGWTPVFGLISGLVVQTGGMLSHAAIVAREYGIPAVTGVAEACRNINTNDYLEVNGRDGTVAILNFTGDEQARAI